MKSHSFHAKVISTFTFQHNQTVSFPTPPPHAIEHSQKLIHHIKQLIDQQNGYISFERYMQEALYAPGLGYYMAGSQKFGQGGDFITAPHLSPLFGQCVAHFFLKQFDTLNVPRNALELGAGNGLLAAQVIEYCAKQDKPVQDYFILELSPDCQARQQETLAPILENHPTHVHWLTSLPEHFEGVIFGNEVVDALPIDRVIKLDNTLQGLGVTWQNNRFAWQPYPLTPDQAQLVESMQLRPETWPNHYTTELPNQVKPWLTGLEQALKRGIILLIDYGLLSHDYYHPHREEGTLTCYYQHHGHNDPFVYPGLQDITAQVNFEWLMDCADSLGLTVECFTTQAEFLLHQGIERLIDNPPSLEQHRALRRLLMPDMMGERFKVVVLDKRQ